MSVIEFCNCHLRCSRDSLSSFTESLPPSLTNSIGISIDLFSYRGPQATRELASRRAVHGISDSADDDLIFNYRECSLMQRLIADMLPCVLSSIKEVSMHEVRMVMLLYMKHLRSMTGTSCSSSSR